MKPICFRRSRSARSGFSLVEMIGVLAIIAILAVVIVPKVFSTIAAARVTQAVGSVTSLKAAVTDFVGQYGTMPTTGNSSRIDDLLVTAGKLEGRFLVKLGQQPPATPVPGATWTFANGTWTAAGGSNQNNESRIICRNSNANPPNTATGSNFRLDGATSLPAGSRVVCAVISNLRASEAREISLRLDGESLSEAGATTADADGKVVYAAPNGNGITDAYIYIAHQ